MKAPIIVISIAVLIILIACSTTDQPTDQPKKVLDSIEILTDTMSIEDFGCKKIHYPQNLNKQYETTYIIRNDSDYYNKLKFYCPNVQLPVIDFSKYSLLGYLMGSDIDYHYPKGQFIKTVYFYKYDKKLVYHLLVYKKYSYDVGWYDMNWVLVPAISNDIRVEFDTTQVLVKW